VILARKPVYFFRTYKRTGKPRDEAHEPAGKFYIMRE
jgi:hypothetical protein